MDTLFLAPIHTIENADQTIREIMDEIDRIARATYDRECGTMISHYLGNWSVTLYGARIETLIGVRHECLLDALHDLRNHLAAKQRDAALLAATLGIEPVAGATHCPVCDGIRTWGHHEGGWGTCKPGAYAKKETATLGIEAAADEEEDTEELRIEERRDVGQFGVGA